MVFIVDDEPMMGRMIEASLAAHNYRTKAFQDPAVAVEAFRCSDPKPELLITDYQMPEMTGLELIRQCKATEPRLKVILCSGTIEEDFLTSVVPQPDIFLSKPFPTGTLLRAIKSLLGES